MFASKAITVIIDRERIDDLSQNSFVFSEQRSSLATVGTDEQRLA